MKEGMYSKNCNVHIFTVHRASSVKGRELAVADDSGIFGSLSFHCTHISFGHELWQSVFTSSCR